MHTEEGVADWTTSHIAQKMSLFHIFFDKMCEVISCYHYAPSRTPEMGEETSSEEDLALEYCHISPAVHFPVGSCSSACLKAVPLSRLRQMNL